jgi:hypothetical protein
MSLEGQKHELPRRSIGVRFALNKQTLTERVQCDAMCQKLTDAVQQKPSLDYIVGAQQNRRWQFNADCFGSLEV